VVAAMAAGGELAMWRPGAVLRLSTTIPEPVVGARRVKRLGACDVEKWRDVECLVAHVP